MKQLKNKTITDVPGFLASGISIGIKEDNKKDLCIIYSKYKATAAAVFTTNKMKAAPLLVDIENIKNYNTQAIVINSGNANSCTGYEGIDNATKMIATAAQCLNLSPSEVLVASTGTLAKQLPMNLIIPGIKTACNNLESGTGFDAAEAILSTDTKIKTIAVEFQIDNMKVTIAGITKGSTMIHPDMGTTLCFIVTDINISKNILQAALKKCIDKSYNMISIDGDTSTNDMAVILANGSSLNKIIASFDESYDTFCEALSFVTTELAKMIVKDGEGATKFIEVEVTNAKTAYDAKVGAKAIVSSNLIKCECFGSSMKWSTIACVLGYSNIEFNENDFDISIMSGENNIKIVEKAQELQFNEEFLNFILSQDCIKILISLNLGKEKATAWGCDLTYDYVKANGYL